MTLMTEIQDILRNGLIDIPFDESGIRSPHFYHDFAMLFLYAKIRKNSGKEFIKGFSGKIGLINHSAIAESFSLFRHNFLPEMNTKKVLQPLHNGYIHGSKFQYRSIMNTSNACAMFYCINVKTSITIDISCKVSKVQFFFHIDSFSTLHINIEYKSTLNDLTSGPRKRMRKSEHNVYMKVVRMIRRDYPANVKRIYIGHKSNRMPVLNSAAARLGQALDKLGAFKSSLIDSKFPSGNAEDNEAQAILGCAA
jgi:hypothetical protein